MRRYNRDVCSTDRLIAFIHRELGTAVIEIYRIGKITEYGGKLARFETRGRGAKSAAMREMKKLECNIS